MPEDTAHKITLNIGEFEETVLLATVQLGEDAYGLSILRAIEAAGRGTSIGAVYATLDRLQEKGLVRSWMGEATAERGGRAKKYFAIEGTGRDALDEAEQLRKRLRRPFNGLQPAGAV